MNNHIIIGDIHGRDEEPFYSSTKRFFDWFLSDSNLNSQTNTLVFLGDIFHEARSNGKAIHLIMDFFNNLLSNDIKIIMGNHDYSKKDGSGLLPLSIFPKVHVIERPTYEVIGGVSYLFLPYYYPFSNDLPPMEEFYSNVEGSYDKIGLPHKADFILAHVADETQTLFKKYCDLSHLEGTRVSGHIHKRSKNYLGSVSIVRSDERHKSSQIAIIYPLTKEIGYLETPFSLDYVDLPYGENPINITKADIPYLDINNAPSQEEALQKYKGFYIYSIETKENETVVSNTDFQASSRSIDEYFKAFVEKNKVPDDIRDEVYAIVSENS